MPQANTLPFMKVDQEYTVASLPDATTHKGVILFCSNGAAGSAALVRSDGTNWKVIGGAAGTTAAAS